MPTASDAKLAFESGRTAYPMSALTDSGDRIKFTSSATHFSRYTGSAPDVRPNGIITGGTVSVAASGSNDVVDGAALTCYLAGVKTSVSASADLAITRAVTNVSKVNSITITSGGAYAVVTGTDGSTTAFSETRGAAGGPPYIPTGSIEVAQVRTTTSAAAAVTAAQIFQVPNVHQELYDYPGFEIDYANAEVNFDSALPAIHTGDIGKAVYASYSDPIFTDLSKVSDFTPPENTYSVSSKQIYGKTLGSSSSTLGQGSFTVYMNDGIGDTIAKNEGKNLFFKFWPDRTKTPHWLSQGILGIKSTFPVGDEIQGACTISADEAATRVNV